MNDTNLTTSAALRASAISISSNATLTSSSVISGNLDFNTNGRLNLQDGASFSGSISSGGIVGEGVINSAGAATISSAIGSDGSISAINVASGSHLTIGNNDSSTTNSIEAENINITGQLDLIDATTISGDVVMLGSSSKLDLRNNSHTINGNFTTASGSRIYSTIHSLTSLDRLIISGAATINSNTKLSLAVGAITPGSSYVIISGGSGSSLSAIANSNIDVDNSGKNRSGRYIFSTSVSGNDLILSSTPLALTTNNNNQSTAYEAIINPSTGGALSRLQDYIFDATVSDAAKNEAINSALPQIDNSNNRIVFNAANASFDLTSSRLAELRNSRDNIKINYNFQQKNPLNRFDFNPDKLFADKDDYNNSIWSKVFASNIKHGNSSLAEGYNANVRGLAFGFDRKIEKDFYLGISASYANSDTKSRNKLKKTSIDSYQINIYSGHDFEKYFINNLIGFVWNNYKSSRAISAAASIASAEYSGQNYIARIEGGGNFKLAKNYILTPSATITAAHNTVENYSEKHAETLNLQVRTASSNFFETRFGANLKKDFSFKNIDINPEVFASYGYDFAGAKQRTSSNFIGQSITFDSTSNNLASASFKTGFATTIQKILHLNYTHEKRINYQANSLELKVVYKF